ncbi:MAG: DEAD/DEAH box helicase [Bacteroidetes bacterium]|jgi:superfamily II DNA/RNA helicase|nr:MAG: DEAD/DEAH box helicase [Bacteroidota bacterium]
MIRENGFVRYNLHERVMLAIEKLNFHTPSPVQHQVIPLFMQHKNLIVEAPTGTGKTAAYGFPLISKLDLLKRSTQALVMVPSRELAFQVSAALQSYFEGDQLRIGALFGGVTLAESFAVLKSAPHILVVVPGRLRDVMAQYQHDFLWRDIKYLIADEGDKLLETGFQKDFDDIRGNVRKSVQCGFFSATIPPDSEDMIRERFEPVHTIRLEPRKALRNLVFFRTEVPDGGRENTLAAILKQERISRALIFGGRRDTLYAVTGFLRNLGLKTEGFYGNQTQAEREHILKRFKEGQIDFLVASDLAARGLDIEGLDVVINLQIPEAYDYYLHRVGRTGRAGNPGWVFNLIQAERDDIRLEKHHSQLGLPFRPLKIKPATEAALEQAETADKWIKFSLSRGKRDKIRTGDVAGFLIHAAGLEAKQIGTITIEETHTMVDIPLSAFERLQKEEDLKIKGKTVRLRRFSAEDEEKKALGVRKLKRERRTVKEE